MDWFGRKCGWLVIGCPVRAAVCSGRLGLWVVGDWLPYTGAFSGRLELWLVGKLGRPTRAAVKGCPPLTTPARARPLEPKMYLSLCGNLRATSSFGFSLLFFLRVV